MKIISAKIMVLLYLIVSSFLYLIVGSFLVEITFNERESRASSLNGKNIHASKHKTSIKRTYKLTSRNGKYTIILTSRHPSKEPPYLENWDLMAVLDKYGKKMAEVNWVSEGNSALLMSSIVDDVTQSWSPDGRYLAFYLVDEDGRQELRVMDLENGVETQFSPVLVSTDNFQGWKQGKPHTALVFSEGGGSVVETNP
jgi:Tol biopolymer transport system component